MNISQIQHKNRLKAATLLEILLVIAIFLGMTVLVMPFGIKQVQAVKLDGVVKNCRSLITTMQQNSYQAKDNKSYGISFSSGQYILFSGTDLTNAESQETIALPTNYSIQSINFINASSEITFSKGSMKPSTYGDLVFTDGLVTNTITINKEGIISIS